MRNLTAILFLTAILLVLSLIFGCKPVEKLNEHFCGDKICHDNEDCKEDCGGFADITRQDCEKSGGKWNDCGSPCAGTEADFCIQVCQAQCECDNIQFTCPDGFRCRLSGKANEIGVCI